MIIPTGLTLVYIPIEEIEPYEKWSFHFSESDPLIIDIKANGLQHPIEITYCLRDDKLRPFIADGHHRFLILKMLGYKMIPCVDVGNQTKSFPHPPFEDDW